MKIEVQAARAAKRGLSLHDRLVGYLPRYAPLAAKWPRLANLRNDKPRLARWSEKLAGLEQRGAACRAGGPTASGKRRTLSARRTRRRSCSSPTPSTAISSRRTSTPRSPCWRRPDAACICRSRRSRPLCCGRTFLAVGLVDEARREAERCVAALAPLAERGIPVVGLEPSCVLGFRDEIPALVKTDGGAPAGRAARCCSRNISRARRRRAGSSFRSSRWPSARCCTATATRNPSAPWARSRPRSSWCRTWRSRPSSRAAAAWPAPSAITPTPSTCRSRWPSCRCCRRCARPRPTRWWSPTAPPAGTRSRTAPAARRSTWRGCCK